tara:strand:- start:60 stop:392 length:333 start_codon:yes stop_codon:yes gene_type:complete
MIDTDAVRFSLWRLSLFPGKSRMIPLQLLNAGETADIAMIGGETSLVTRLNEMGFREGEVVHMVRSGEPCIVAVGNHRLTFRGNETAHIFVNLLSHPPHPSATVTGARED